MDIKIKKEDFLKTLSFTQNVVEKKSTMPILANVLMETENKSLKVSATDLEVGVSVNCPSEVLKTGKVTVFAKGLFDIIKELPNELIHIKTLENHWLSIKCGKSNFKIVGMSADEFPTIPVSKEGATYVEDGATLLGMIEKTSFAMSTDETRYNLNGIFLQQAAGRGKEGIRMVATDGHRLSITERESKSKWKIGKGLIVPRKGVLELRKLLESCDGDLSLTVDEKNISVVKDNVCLVVRLIEGQFPPYEQVVPKDNKKVVIVDRDGFIRALRRVSLLASDRTKGVKLSFSPGHIEVSTSNPDYGEATEDVEATYKGETFSIGFNAKYFLDILHVLEDEKVVLELKNDVSPCLIRSEFDKGLLNVIMPMRM
jgi:DNA polymerase-3 subunit beta